MDTNTVLYILAGLAIVAGIVAFNRPKSQKVLGLGKNLFAGIAVIIGVALIAMQLGYLADYGLPALSAGTAVSNNVVTTGSGSVITTYQPTATFSAKDAFATTAITGTSYYKRGSNPASTTAISNTNPGESITYWVSNTTYWVTPVTQTAGSGVTAFQALGYANGTATLGGYDLVGRAVSSGGTSNVSMGANKQANIEVTYQGTAKQSAMPFGGLLVVEANSTIASISCTGDDLRADNPFHLTYTVANTNNAYRVFALNPTIDTGNGAVRKIVCQFNNGNSAAGAGSAYYFKFIPANYYVSQNGEILLDTEKFADGDVTRTGSTINYPSLTSYWGA